MNHNKTPRTSTRAILSLTSLALLVTCGLAFAGPLNPHAGPVTGTAKTLTEVEPRIAISAANTPGDATSIFKITQPGSYYLTGSITGVSGKHGIAIASSAVTLDLNGFSLVGSTGALSGVAVSGAGRAGITVFNGAARNWPLSGIDLTIGTPAINCRVKGIVASGNTGQGISAGPGTTVSDCSTYQNGARGISVGTDCTVTACVAYLNAGGGINATDGSTVTRCSVYQNTGAGVSIGEAGTIADCVVRSSTLDGIACGSRCVVRGNVCSNNGNGGTGAGIRTAGTGSQIEDNHCIGADRGVLVQLGANIIIRNTCSLNTIDWEFTADNLYGPIIDRRFLATPPIQGSNYEGALDTADPNANFSI